MACCTHAAPRWLLVAGLALSSAAGAARADDVETRDFTVLVDGRRAGDAHMTIRRLEDGPFGGTRILLGEMAEGEVIECPLPAEGPPADTAADP